MGRSWSSILASPAASYGCSTGSAKRRSSYSARARHQCRRSHPPAPRKAPMLADVPIVLMLVGLAAYTVLAGADFGAGFWILFARGGRTSPAATRDHARHAMGPVWEANHVWLIFVLVVCWTAYPVAFASIMSTLSVPVFVAAIGIILR